MKMRRETSSRDVCFKGSYSFDRRTPSQSVKLDSTRVMARAAVRHVFGCGNDFYVVKEAGADVGSSFHYA